MESTMVPKRQFTDFWLIDVEKLKELALQNGCCILDKYNPSMKNMMYAYRREDGALTETYFYGKGLALVGLGIEYISDSCDAGGAIKILGSKANASGQAIIEEATSFLINLARQLDIKVINQA